MAAKIKKNDEVIVLKGRDKGKKGIIKFVLKSKKVIINGINLVTKHQKPIPARNQSGGIIKKESYISISNIAIFNSLTGKPDRIGFRFENGNKVRFFKSNNKIVK
ncbi:50S ribosomal protein L24 [Buchnera aphidicola (Eriosoma grossulariae)]|uniref:50S ribosomal protein L24 n=1 Tax=Buchnera aphidicola TaxID=9 RepID=UPI0034640A25